VVTATCTGPTGPAGVTAVSIVELTTVTCPAATPLIVTWGVPLKLVPVMVTLVPPVVLPVAGEIPVTVGGDDE
jgi:hypothetical protein